jgi:hypothetical protein
MSHHNQSHQHQPQNPSNVVQPLQPTAVITPSASKSKGGVTGVDASGPQPSADRIRVRAYEISQARNGGPGNAASDWSQAETELTAASGPKA